MVTIILIAINVFIFYKFNMQFSEIEFHNFLLKYGLYPQNINILENWITSGFVHFNQAHLIMNMLALLVSGLILEKRIGSLCFAIVYAASLIGGSYAVYLYIMETGANVVAVGASGAIFGVLAGEAIVSKEFQSFVVSAIIYHAIIYAIQLPIAWYAHVGGAIVGIVITIPFLLLKRPRA